jgi:hypothetical protein
MNQGDIYRNIRYAPIGNFRQGLEAREAAFRAHIQSNGGHITDDDRYEWDLISHYKNREDTRDSNYDAAVLKAKEAHKQFLGHFLAPTQNTQPGRLYGSFFAALLGVLVQPFSYLVYLRKIHKAYKKYYVYTGHEFDGLPNRQAQPNNDQPQPGAPSLNPGPTPNGPQAGNSGPTLGPAGQPPQLTPPTTPPPRQPSPAAPGGPAPWQPAPVYPLALPPQSQQGTTAIPNNPAQAAVHAGATVAAILGSTNLLPKFSVVKAALTKPANAVQPAGNPIIPVPACNKGPISNVRAAQNVRVPLIWAALNPAQHQADQVKTKEKSKGKSGGGRRTRTTAGGKSHRPRLRSQGPAPQESNFG